MLAALFPEAPRLHRIKWRQIVRRLTELRGDIGETKGEVKFGGRNPPVSKIFRLKPCVFGNAGEHFRSNFIAIMKSENYIRPTVF